MSAPSQSPDPSSLPWIELPEPPPGVNQKPVPVGVSVGLTEPDAAGAMYAMLKLTDGTATVEFRFPASLAGNVGQAIAQGMINVQNEAAKRQNGGLMLPAAAGQLLVAAPGTKLPPLQTPGRGGRG